MINKYPYTDFNEYNMDWIIKTVKDLTVQWAETHQEWSDVQTEWENYKNYIDNYFENLNLSQEVSDKIDQMEADGYFSDLFNTLFRSDLINEAKSVTSAWIDDNLLQETGYVIDASLTVANAAADAKAAGDRIATLDNDVDISKDILGFTNSEKIFVPAGNNHSSLSDQTVCDIALNDELYIKVKTDNPADQRSISVAFFDGGTTAVFSMPVTTNAYDYTFVKATANATSFGFYAASVNYNANYVLYIAKGDRSVIVKTNMFTNSVNTMGSLLMSSYNKYVDYNTSTKVITIPADCILVDSGKQFKSLPMSAMSLTHTLATSAIKLYVNPANSTLVEVPYNYDVYAKDYTYVLIGTLRINGEKSVFFGSFPWSIDGKPYGIPGTVSAKLLLGFGKYVNLDTTIKTLTIPADTIVCLSNGVNVIMSQEQVVDFSSLNTSAIKLFFNISSNTFVPYYYADTNAVETINQFYIATIRIDSINDYYTISAEFPWSVNGMPYGIDNATPAYVADCMYKSIVGINHRGYNVEAPENTLPAFKLSKRKGFGRVETDLAFTRDNVPVLLHDSTINRTARNLDGTTISETIYINNIDYDDLANYDFGIWKGAQYAGTPIPTLEQFLKLCRGLGLHPYIEIKEHGTITAAMIHSIIDLAKRNGMNKNVTWISFSGTILTEVKNYDDSARIGYLVNTVDATAITTALSLKTASNEVFIDSGDFSANSVTLCYNAGLPLEAWTIDQTATITSLDPYISGVTSDLYVASQIIYDDMIK